VGRGPEGKMCRVQGAPKRPCGQTELAEVGDKAREASGAKPWEPGRPLSGLCSHSEWAGSCGRVLNGAVT
jgi:hypothetical protein